MDTFALEPMAQLESLISLMRSATFEADLWKAQNTYYDVMVQVASLASCDLSSQWLDRFVSLGDCLGMVRVPWSATRTDMLDQETTDTSRLPGPGVSIAAPHSFCAQIA
jgi:hypothetical protein